MSKELDELRKVILSLLLARKGATPVPVLDRDYYDMEKKRIPYRQFGYTDLVGFLQSMPEHFIVEQYNGGHYVRGIASEKSKHVSSLVARQKISQKTRPNPSSFHLRQPYNRRMQNMKPQQVKIAPDKLFLLMQHIKNNPSGVSLQNAVVFVQQMVPFINISTQELRAQLHELSHQLFLDGNMIYPVWSKDLRNAVRQQPLMEEPQSRDKSPNDSESPPTTQTVFAAGQEDFDDIQYLSDENDFVSANCANNYQRHAETSNQFATNLAQYANCEQTDLFNYNKDNNTEVNEDFATMNSNTEIKTAECFDLSQMINDRTKSRLEELMRKYPDGIWCADLPNIYFHEYKVRLNYNQLGFASVREFTSYLPKIFYMTQVNKTDDFRLYSADKRPVVPKTEPVDIVQTSNNRYEHSTMQAQCSNNNDDDAPIPSEVSPTITQHFAPNDVINYNDNVEKISVTELKHGRQYLEVYVIEVFHPNFFWVHLRENKKRFNKMMDELSEFYDCNRSTYTIAKVALKKEMHCACVYMSRWHRGIIKSVKPDYRVTIFFYDYGTLKTYAPEDVYYLHKKFSYLPAQAIPCGLYNVKPIVGDRWKKSVIDQFVDKIADHLLAATIISIDPTYNSMIVILTDTSEEEDVHINDWLVKERLAQVGKTVRMHDIIYYLTSDTIKSSTPIKISHAESVVDVNRPRHYRNQSISQDEKTYRLSDVKSEDIENKTVKSLHNVPTSKKALLQMLWSKSPDSKSSHAKSLDAKCPDAKALDVKSQSKNYQKREPESPQKLVPVLERLKTLNRNRKSNSNPNTFISETDTDNENNTRQIDSNRKVKSRNNNEDYNYFGYMNFGLRDSDEDDTKDFGTFRSLYGGHGLMEPFDWSVITDENNLGRTTMPDNLDMSIRKHDSEEEDKSEDKSHNQKNEISGKQYFLSITCMEKENFVSENNIDYDVENMSDFIEMLRDKTAPNIVTVMFAPNNKLETSQDSSQSEDTSNSNINIVELNNVTSSKEMDQKINGNDKVCETRSDQKMENTDSNTDSESVLSNMSIYNAKGNIIGEMSDNCDTSTSLDSNLNNKVYHPKYKMLLDKMKRKQMDVINSNFVNASESSSSEQIQSSSYNCNTSDDTIISSNDEQSETSNYMDTNNHKMQSLKVEELKSTSKERPKNLTLNESHNYSETDFITSSDIDDVRRLTRSFSSDSSVSACNVDDSCQSNTVDQMEMNVPKLMQQMLKIVQNISNTELDSDDFSSRESVKSDESDESKRDKSDHVFNTCKSMDNDMNVTEITPPIYNDCDVESDDSEWDAYAGSIKDFPYFLFTSRDHSTQITEIES